MCGYFEGRIQFHLPSEESHFIQLILLICSFLTWGYFMIYVTRRWPKKKIGIILLLYFQICELSNPWSLWSSTKRTLSQRHPFQPQIFMFQDGSFWKRIFSRRWWIEFRIPGKIFFLVSVIFLWFHFLIFFFICVVIFIGHFPATNQIDIISFILAYRPATRTFQLALRGSEYCLYA